MTKELAVKMHFYMGMKIGETEEEANKRAEALISALTKDDDNYVTIHEKVVID